MVSKFGWRSWKCAGSSQRQISNRHYNPSGCSRVGLGYHHESGTGLRGRRYWNRRFNDAIAAAGGQSSTAGSAPQNGKIKNKVLKLQTDVLRLHIEQAQGKTRHDDQISQQTTKLNTNVALNQKAAGQTSQSVNFAGTD